MKTRYLILTHTIFQLVILVSGQSIPTQTCPTLSQYDILKGQISFIKYISGTSLYAVADNQNKFVVADSDSALIKSSFQTFQAGGSNQSSQIISIELISSLSMYVVTQNGITIRDIGTMTDQQVQGLNLNSIGQPSGSSTPSVPIITQFKVDPTNSGNLYFGINLQGPTDIYVAYFSNNRLSSFQLTLQSNPPPPPTVTLIGILVNLQIQNTQFTVVVGQYATNLCFSFIQMSQDPQNAVNPQWDVTPKFPNGCSAITSQYFDDNNSLIYIAFQCLPKNQIQVYDMTQSKLTKVPQPQGPDQNSWTLPTSTPLNSQITQTINLIKSVTINNSQYLFMGASQSNQQMLIFGSLIDFKQTSYNSANFQNKITALDYLTGTSTIILGTLVSEIIHFNYVQKLTSINTKPSNLQNYDTVSLDSSDNLLMLSSTVQPSTAGTIGKFNIKFTQQTSPISLVSNLQKIYCIAIYDQTTFARALLIQVNKPGTPPTSTLQVMIEFQIQQNDGTYKSYLSMSLLQVQDINSPISFVMQFTSSKTIAIAYQSQTSAIAIVTYNQNPSPSVAISYSLPGVISAKQIWLIADSNNNIIIPNGPNLYCYQYTQQPPALTQNSKISQLSFNGVLQNIYFLTGDQYIGAFVNQPQQNGVISVLYIYSYNPSTMDTTVKYQTTIISQATNLIYSSSNKIIAITSGQQYQLFYLDTVNNKLTSILTTQQIGSSVLNYFITSTGSLLIASSSGIIKLDISSNCITQTCTQCALNAYYNIPLTANNPSQLTDQNGSGKTNTDPYISLAKFYSFYWDVINTFSSLSNQSFTSIYIVNYIQLGSQFINQQNLFNIYSAISSGSLGTVQQQPQFSSIYIVFQSFNNANSQATRYQYFFSSSLTLPSNLASVTFQDIEFCQLSQFSGNLFTSSSNLFMLSNVGFSTTDALKNYQVTSLQIQLLAGQQFNLAQSSISNLQFPAMIPALINVNSYLTVTVDTVVFDGCNFNGASLIKGNNPSPQVIINNSKILNSQIVQANQVQVFISFSQLIITTFTIQSNTIKNFLLFQNQECTDVVSCQSVSVSISTLTLKSNQVTIGSSQVQFGLQISFSSSNLQNQICIQNSSISQNTVTIVSSGSQQQGSDILKSISQNFFLVASNVFNVTMITVTFIDNGATGFMQGTKMQGVNITSLSCSQSQLSLSQSQSSCLNLLEHTKLNLNIATSSFKNIFVLNGYVISITTSSFTSVDSGSYDGSVKISNTQFENISIQTNSEFITGSVINYNTLQQDSIILDTVTFTTIKLTTPTKVFSPLGSALTVYAPFSNLAQTTCTFQNFQSNGPKGPQEINVRIFSIIKGTFLQSNYQQNIYTQTGGFGKLTARQGSIDTSTFSYANALTGGALYLVPTISQSVFTITNSQFTMLSSIQDGGAIMFAQITDQTTLGLTGCTFSYIFSLGNGGCINSAYVLSTNSDITSFTNIPTINMSKSTINDVFSTQGGILYVQNMNLNIDNMTVSGINSNIAKTSNNDDVSQTLKDFVNFGPLFYIYQSNVSFKTSVFDALKIHLSISQNQDTNFMVSTYKSILNFNDLNITNAQFSNSNFIVISNSTFTCTTLNITTAQYQAQSSTRLLNSRAILQERSTRLSQIIPKQLDARLKILDKNDRLFDIRSRLLHKSFRILQSTQSIDASQAISLLVIQKLSTITATGIYIQKVTCSAANCFGGGILINQSSGSVSSSNISFNSATYGGGFAIYNPSNTINIQGVTLNNNTASSNGGGLFFYLTSSQQLLNIQKSTLDGNVANIGGGAYLNQVVASASDPSKVIVTITDTSISSNTCNLYGGGISYVGVDPSMTNTKLLDNQSKTSFGVNKFSSPASLVWNKEKTNKNSANQIILNQTNVNGVVVYTLPDQQSAQTVTPLIFNLLDSDNAIITTDYTNLLTTKVTSTITVDSSLSTKIYLTEQNVYSFDPNNYFNYTNINIAGIPGSPVILNVQSNQIIDPVTQQEVYKIVLKFNLLYCVRGEVFQAFNFITPNDGAKMFYQCNYCKSGTYSIIYPKLEDTTVHTCQKCSNNAQCPGGDVIQVNPSYWRINDQDDLLIYCENAPGNCLGGATNSTCSIGHVGALCESCDIENNYTRAGNFQCANCGDVLLNSLKVIGLMAFYVLSAKMSVNGILGKVQQEWHGNVEMETNASIILKLFLTYIQIIMVMTTFNISVPNTLNTGVSSVSSPTVQVLYSFECFFYQISLKTNINIIYIALIFDLILPIICVIMFVLSGLISYRNNIFYKSFYIYTSLLYCLMYFQPNIFKDAISLASCRDIGRKSYIRYNVFFECDTDEYKVWTVRFVLPVILVLVFIIPGLILWRIKVNQNTKLGQRKFSFMTSEYTQKAFYWEIVKMNLKLFIMCSLNFLEHDYPNKIMSIFFLVVVYGVLLFFVKPYNKELYNTIDKYSMAVLCLSIYFGFIAYYNNATFWVWLIAVVLIGILNIIFIIWCIQNLILAYIPLVKSQQKNYYNILMSIRFIRNKFFSKERRIRYLWMFWMKGLIKQLKDMKLYNPLSFDPEKNRISRKMIIKALKEKTKEGELQIGYESQDKKDEDEDDDENTEKGDKKKYLKMKVIDNNKFSSVKLLEKQLQNVDTNKGSPPTSYLTSTPINQEQIALDIK
ncbi:transmembrane protein, putative (macronuclear) [Tetrahymena thermophila SB210]|uniref:Transmembrane protein, putative n=1 Tax=Tetrahymena thermophila (strain SB210) TaxID=312017 RepID=Q22A03_TETTS|nr:transmembrane protein, putative [Tetrahymena thermophila SB210]EAR82108.2 transmembrane protein, putative [Tetrahymena thermophila SB210]|eukprot:XP_001029771.2 transmembrane protein, putative [Tetrahymena thermophila SB210]